MLLPPDPPPPSPEKPTAPLSRSEIQTGLLEKLVGAVADMKQTVQESQQMVQESRAENAEEFKAMRADMGLIANDLGVVKDRVVLVEKRADDLENRANSNSMRAKHSSEVDLETQSRLAQEIVSRKEIAAKVVSLETQVASVETKTDAQTLILSRLDKVASAPVVKLIVHAIAMGLVAWLAAKGIHVGGN